MFLFKQALLRFVFLSSALATVLPGSANAATFNIGSMNITGGSYTVWDSSGVLVVNPSSGSSTSLFTTIGPNTNLVGGYIGNGGGGLPVTTPDSASIVGAVWFGFSFSTYTAAENLGDDLSPAGSISGGQVPYGTLDDGNSTITMNLSSFFGNWNNFDLSVGTGKNDGITSALATGAWNPATKAYTMSWFSTVDSVVGGPCLPTQCTVQFIFEGTANPVPIPATFWLFGSGLMSVFMLARKRSGLKNG